MEDQKDLLFLERVGWKGEEGGKRCTSFATAQSRRMHLAGFQVQLKNEGKSAGDLRGRHDGELCLSRPVALLGWPGHA